MNTRRGYLSFLLRLWSVREEDKTHWRAVLKQVDTGEERTFNNLDQLIACLRQLTQGVNNKHND